MTHTHSYENYGLAVEEIRLSKNLKNLSQLLNDFDKSQKPKYLLQSIANLERRLDSIKKQRAA